MPTWLLLALLYLCHLTVLVSGVIVFVGALWILDCEFEKENLRP